MSEIRHTEKVIVCKSLLLGRINVLPSLGQVGELA